MRPKAHLQKLMASDHTSVDPCELFYIAWKEYLSLRMLPKDRRESAVRGCLQKFEYIAEIAESDGHISRNESARDLDQDSIPFLLPKFFIGAIVNDYVNDNRPQALKTANNNMVEFLEGLSCYKLLTPDELAALAPPDNEDPEYNDGSFIKAASVSADTRESNQAFAKALAKRQAAMLEMQTQKEVALRDDRLTHLISSGGSADFIQEAQGALFKALLLLCKLSAIKELSYIREELSLLVFEQRSPELAAQIRSSNETAPDRYDPADKRSRKIQMVSLNENDARALRDTEVMTISTEHDVQRLRELKEKMTSANSLASVVQAVQRKPGEVPLDSIELLRQGNFKAALAGTDKWSAEDWKSVHLVYGGGNPYTGEGMQGHENGRTYQVTRTDTFQPGQVDSEDDEDKPRSDVSDDEARREAIEWDDYKDEHKRGSGNRLNKL